MTLGRRIVLHTCVYAVEIPNGHSLLILLSFATVFLCLESHLPGSVHDGLPIVIK